MSHKQANLIIFLLCVIAILLLRLIWQNQELFDLVNGCGKQIFGVLDRIRSSVAALVEASNA